MAGTGASYGFVPITEIGSALEHAALERDIAHMRSRIDELETYLAKIDVH